MAFEVIAASEGSLSVRDLSDERVWQFLIIERNGHRELSDTVQSGPDAKGGSAGIGEDVPAFAFATDEALARGLID